MKSRKLQDEPVQLMYKYEPSDQYYDKPEGFSPCACMGPVHGEPFCACMMAREGLPMSKDHVEACEQAKLDFEAALRQYGWQ